MTGSLADALVEAGHSVSVIAANPSYPYWKLFPGYSSWRWTRTDEGGVDVHRVPVFIPAKVGGLTRILHYGSFVLNSTLPAMRLALQLRPDLVILVAPTLLAAPLARLTATFAGAKSWLHVQDFEVEAAFATGQIHSGGFIARIAMRFERACIRMFDQASSISTPMCQKLVQKGNSPTTVYELRNWSDVSAISPRPHSFYRRKWGISTPHVVLYSGSIAKKQGIEVIVKVAEILAYREDISFVICGDGPGRSELEASAFGLKNIQFHDLQPKKSLNDLLALATIHILPQKADAADLVLPSKLANMLASGRPVIAGVAPGTGLAAEVEDCGLIAEPENADSLAAAVLRLVDSPELHARFSKNARRRAEDRWDRRGIIAALGKRLLELQRGKFDQTQEGKVTR